MSVKEKKLLSLWANYGHLYQIEIKTKDETINLVVKKITPP